MTGLILLALVPACVIAQPAFEVATVRASVENTPYSLDAGADTVNIRGARMLTILRWAYDVQESQISGPDWLDSARFDISAKAATPVPESELHSMLQTLLADRFKLAAHRESKQIPAFVMTVAKGGHKLKPATGDGPPSFKTGRMNLTGERASIAQLTEFLSRQIKAPILDETGLTGQYNYFLDILAYITDDIRESARGGRVPIEGPAIIANALQEQLGLKLDSAKIPVPVVVIDNMEKAPSQN
jgi:uncharacterized protein (TIGR03435 family)